MPRNIVSIKVVMSVDEGCFTTDDDLLTYVKFRLGLRSRVSDSIRLLSVEKEYSTMQEVML